MLKAIIIDDERTSRETLFGLLKRYCPQVEVVAEAYNLESGKEILKAYNADVVFLDIQMPDGSGFKLLEEIEEIKFEVVFTTAFDQYAIKAIKYSALDYLLKPIVPEDLMSAVAKLEKRINVNPGTSSQETIKTLIDNIRSPQMKKIVLSTSKGMHVIEIENIIRCESEDYYTRFFLKDGKMIMVSKTLKENEEMLGENDFIRPHKSHLVNINHIKGFLKEDGGSLLMNDGSIIPVSRRKREKVIDLLNHL